MPMAGTNDPFVVNISVDARTLELYDYEKDDIMRWVNFLQLWTFFDGFELLITFVEEISPYMYTR